jgi:hypothetical protein
LKKAAAFGDPYHEGLIIDGEKVFPDIKHLVELGEDESPLETDDDLEIMFDYFDGHGKLVDINRGTFRTYFFRDVIAPMWNAYALYKDGKKEEAFELIGEELKSGNNTDWIVAGYLWLQRRVNV